MRLILIPYDSPEALRLRWAINRVRVIIRRDLVQPYVEPVARWIISRLSS